MPLAGRHITIVQSGLTEARDIAPEQKDRAGQERRFLTIANPLALLKSQRLEALLRCNCTAFTKLSAAERL